MTQPRQIDFDLSEMNCIEGVTVAASATRTLPILNQKIGDANS
jgi:hypothetical protein